MRSVVPVLILGSLNLSVQQPFALERDRTEGVNVAEPTCGFDRLHETYARLVKGRPLGESRCEPICDGISCDKIICDKVCDTICQPVCDLICDLICEEVHLCAAVCEKNQAG
ncbi:MAG: hypothetical protein HY696_04280 [Deltaproteobacteria bacterium]|nr:hypothetical protein [Deltaproteobacteria bacterium]